jgi:hypothetical protein
MATAETKPTEPVAAPAPAAAPAAAVDITKTPEFIAAMAQMQSTMLASMQAILAASQGAPGKDTISELTAAIVGMNDPKNLERRITPAEAERRAAAFQAMGALITQMRAEKATAKYQVATKVYLTDQLIEPFVPLGNGVWAENEVYWNGVPGPGLRPIDERAHAIFEQYLIYIGGSTKNQAGVIEQPAWVQGGLVMMGTPTQTASARGGVKQVQPLDLTSMNPTDIKSTTDNPNAKAVRVLGSIAEPARVTEAGNIPSAHIS